MGEKVIYQFLKVYDFMRKWIFLNAGILFSLENLDELSIAPVSGNKIVSISSSINHQIKQSLDQPINRTN